MELRVFWTGKEYQSVREGFTKKVAVLLDFVQMRGKGPVQIFRHLLISAFLVKRSLFSPKCQYFEHLTVFRLYT